MLTQQQWVEGCYAYYAENGYEPGNPEDGEWHDCHYPVPRCAGGSETIKLLKQHHAVQGVLQSEEHQRPCIWGWEADYLEGEMLALCKKWAVEQRKLAVRAKTTEQRRAEAIKANANRSPEQRSEIAKRAAASQTPKQRSDKARRANASRSPEQRSEIIRKGWAGLSPEQRSERQLRAAASQTPEQRSENARKAWEARRRNAEAAKAAGG
jgi:hypothetical protein